MRILMINLPFAGHTNPTLPLTRELVRRGHDVTYVNAERFRKTIEQTGALFVPYRDFPPDISEDDKKKKCFEAAFAAAMSLEGPFDLLIYEMFFYPGYEIARKMGIPCVRQFSQTAWSEETWQNAPWIFRLSARLIDMQVFPQKKAAAMGLELTCLRDGILHSKPDLNIVYVPEGFQNCRDSFDDRFVFLTPKPEAVPCDVQIPYENIRKPIVYISLGSIISNRGFCKEIIRGFGNKAFSVILNTGRIDPGSLGKIPENIYAYSFVPQIEVLQHADVFLTHCGMNSINEALHLGVPMVAMPFLNDQLTNARQLVRLGLAKQVRSFPSSEKELYRTVCRVYESEDIRQNLARMKEQLCTGMDLDDIVTKIEMLTQNKGGLLP